MSSFTTGKVIRIHPKYIGVQDSFGNLHSFSINRVVPDDLEAIRVGSLVLINDSREVELATSSFNRWRDQEQAREIFISEDITHSDE